MVRRDKYVSTDAKIKFIKGIVWKLQLGQLAPWWRGPTHLVTSILTLPHGSQKKQRLVPN